jgi:O-antigen/teichoic acid export membrane protein
LLQGTALIDLLLPKQMQSLQMQSLALWLVPLVMLTQQSGRFAQMLLSGQARFRSIGLKNISTQVLSALLLICLFVAGSTTPWHYIAATLAASLVNIALTVREVWALPLTTERLFLKEALIYSLPLALGNLIQFLNYKLDVFMVNWFHGLYSVGIYTLAVSLAQLLWLAPNNLATLILQRAAADDAGRWLPEQVARVSRISLWLSITLALVMAVAAPLLTGVIFGERFAASVAPLLLLLPGIVLFTITIVLSGQLAGVGKQMLTTRVAAAAFACTLLLDLLLIPGMGAIGAAIASTCSYTLSTWLTWRYFKQLYPEIQPGAVFVLQREDLHNLWALLQRTWHRRVTAEPV